LNVYGILPSPIAQGNAENNTVATSSNGNYNFDIFPNPAQPTLTIKYSDDFNAEQQIAVKIINSIGETVYNQNITISKAGVTRTIDLPSTIKDGLYIVEIINFKGTSSTKKLVIKN
jgi:hypothetical protein